MIAARAEAGVAQQHAATAAVPLLAKDAVETPLAATETDQGRDARESSPSPILVYVSGRESNCYSLTRMNCVYVSVNIPQ